MSGAAWAFDAVYTPVDTQFLQDAAAEGLQILSRLRALFLPGPPRDLDLPRQSTWTRPLLRAALKEYSHAERHRHGLPRRHAARQAHGDRRGRLRGRRDLRDRHHRPRRPARGGRPHGPRPRARAHRLPAVPRLRGHARSRAPAHLRPRPPQARDDGRARRRRDSASAPTSRPTRSAASTAPPTTSAHSARSPTASASRSPSRRWPGAASSATGATPGRSCAAPTTPRVKLLLDSFHALAPGYPVEPIARDPGDRISFVQLADAPRDRHGRPPALAPPPPLPGPGRPADRRLHGGGRAPPASTAGSATRSSTTASAWPRPGASPPTASAR